MEAPEWDGGGGGSGGGAVKEIMGTAMTFVDDHLP